MADKKISQFTDYSEATLATNKATTYFGGYDSTLPLGSRNIRSSLTEILAWLQGEGITQGAPVNGGTANRVLYVDNSGNLATNTGLRFTGTQVQVGDGSAATPFLANVTNTTTGLFFSRATNTERIQFAIGGTEELRIFRNVVTGAAGISINDATDPSGAFRVRANGDTLTDMLSNFVNASAVSRHQWFANGSQTITSVSDFVINGTENLNSINYTPTINNTVLTGAKEHRGFNINLSTYTSAGSNLSIGFHVTGTGSTGNTQFGFRANNVLAGFSTNNVNTGLTAGNATQAVFHSLLAANQIAFRMVQTAAADNYTFASGQLQPSTPIATFNFANINYGGATTVADGTRYRIMFSYNNSTGTEEMRFTRDSVGSNISSWRLFTNSVERLSMVNNRLGINNATPDASAALDIVSTTGGILPPRMTSTQASAITPVNGLMLYSTDTNSTFTRTGHWFYADSSWRTFDPAEQTFTALTIGATTTITAATNIKVVKRTLAMTQNTTLALSGFTSGSMMILIVSNTSGSAWDVTLPTGHLPSDGTLTSPVTIAISDIFRFTVTFDGTRYIWDWSKTGTAF